MRAPQAEKMPDASTSNKHYGGYAKVTICSLTTTSPKHRMSAQPLPRMTPTMQSAWQSIPPTHNNQLTIWLAQRRGNTAYRLGSIFNQTIKKLNKNKYVSFAKQN
jgi:hypothetical protein